MGELGDKGSEGKREQGRRAMGKNERGKRAVAAAAMHADICCAQRWLLCCCCVWVRERKSERERRDRRIRAASAVRGGRLPRQRAVAAVVVSVLMCRSGEERRETESEKANKRSICGGSRQRPRCGRSMVADLWDSHCSRRGGDGSAGDEQRWWLVTANLGRRAVGEDRSITGEGGDDRNERRWSRDEAGDGRRPDLSCICERDGDTDEGGDCRCYVVVRVRPRKRSGIAALVAADLDGDGGC